MASGTGMALALGLKSSVYPLHVAAGTYPMYAAVPALLVNLAVAAVGTVALRAVGVGGRLDVTAAEAYGD
jgi:SSS family solute:Na+ symporter